MKSLFTNEFYNKEVYINIENGNIISIFSNTVKIKTKYLNMNRVGSHALSTKGWEVVFGRKEYSSCGMAFASTVRDE